MSNSPDSNADQPQSAGTLFGRAKVRFASEFDSAGRLRRDFQTRNQSARRDECWGELVHVEFLVPPTHEELSVLGDCPSLTSLSLSNTPATDEHLASIARCGSSLQRLFASHSDITDIGLGYLQGFSQLRRLTVTGTKITDEALGPVSRLQELRCLVLVDTRITDAGLPTLVGLRHLNLLWLDGTSVTDDGLRYLQPLTTLTRLHLNRTNISDRGLQFLASLPNLRKLHVQKTQVTKEAAEAFKQERNELFVAWGD